MAKSNKEFKVITVKGEVNRDALKVILEMNYHPYKIERLKDIFIFTIEI